jgi:ankyrin repeat protein
MEKEQISIQEELKYEPNNGYERDEFFEQHRIREEVWEAMQIAECERKEQERARVNQRNELGLTPLHQVKSVAAAKKLLEKGADVNAKDERGRTPLHLAANFGKKKIAELLISKGADVNVQDKNGEIPLHTAIIWNNSQVSKEVVQVLLKHGADANIQDNKGNTPLHLAAKKGDTKVVKALVSVRADAKIVNKNGDNPLHMAMDRNRYGSHHETIQLLHGCSEQPRQTNKMSWSLRM